MHSYLQKLSLSCQEATCLKGHRKEPVQEQEGEDGLRLDS